MRFYLFLNSVDIKPLHSNFMIYTAKKLDKIVWEIVNIIKY